jgi:hypothetical protein
LAAGLDLPEDLLVASLPLLGADAGRTIQHASTRRLGPTGTIGHNQKSSAEKDYTHHDKRRRNPHWNQILHVLLYSRIKKHDPLHNATVSPGLG